MTTADMRRDGVPLLGGRRAGGLLVVFAFLLAACSPAGILGSHAPAATHGPPRPNALPRPSDLPLDGTCEEDQGSCLGLLVPGRTYHTTNFVPTVTLSVPSSGWESLTADDGGTFSLESTTWPGDAIEFLRAPQVGDPAIGTSVDALAGWLAANANLTVTKATPVTVGGLSGVTMDLRTSPNATNNDETCPVRACVPLFSGNDPNQEAADPWTWDWANAGAEAQRVYLLTSSSGVVAIFVDSLDGTTFDALTKAFDQIRPNLKFG